MKCSICNKDYPKQEHDLNYFVAIIQFPKGKVVKLNLKWNNIKSPIFSYEKKSWLVIKEMGKWINNHLTFFYKSDDARPIQ